MKYRRLGKTGSMVSEIGFGAEWMERHSAQECKAVLERAEELGINILDCWMSEPNVRSSLGQALDHHADECVGCKGCESRCPFGVKIAERMVKTANLFQK